jgi:hypothetical protein
MGFRHNKVVVFFILMAACSSGCLKNKPGHNVSDPLSSNEGIQKLLESESSYVSLAEQIKTSLPDSFSATKRALSDQLIKEKNIGKMVPLVNVESLLGKAKQIWLAKELGTWEPEWRSFMANVPLNKVSLSEVKRAHQGIDSEVYFAQNVPSKKKVVFRPLTSRAARYEIAAWELNKLLIDQKVLRDFIVPKAEMVTTDLSVPLNIGIMSEFVEGQRGDSIVNAKSLTRYFREDVEPHFLEEAYWFLFLIGNRDVHGGNFYHLLDGTFKVFDQSRSFGVSLLFAKADYEDAPLGRLVPPGYSQNFRVRLEKAFQSVKLDDEIRTSGSVLLSPTEVDSMMFRWRVLENAFTHTVSP